MTASAAPFRAALREGLDMLNRVIVGKPAQVKRAVATLLSGGHLLLEDLPGVGKTTLAKGLSRLMGGTYQRVQGTNDLLPSDLLGVHLWDAQNQTFRFQPGPVFAHVLLLDELNRIGPKTQSALLEVMVEGQVTLDRHVYALPDPFFVIATQNPLDHSGTFLLPESQLDRFSCVVHLGYADAQAERLIFAGQAGSERLDLIRPVLSAAQWAEVRALVKAVKLAEPVLDYAERLVARLRQEGAFCSTRAATQWLNLAKAEAWLAEREFVTPDDLQNTLGDAMAHRGSLDQRRMNREERRAQLARALNEIPVGWKP